jgi:outer membrane immunogenic protein
MRKFGLAIGVSFAIGLAGSAIAADMPMPVKAPLYKAPPVYTYNWSGCYIGANVGGAWSRQDVNSSVPLISDQAPGSATLNTSSVMGGPHAGCNWQFSPSWVIGIEGDWSATDLNGTAALPNLSRAGVPFANGGITFGGDTKWLATIRGRLGFVPVSNVLLYGTGGVAWNSTDYSGSDVFLGGCPNCGTTAFSSTQTGWVAGAGAEWAPWSNNWIFRVEYLHYGFDGTTTSTPARPAFAAAPPTFTWNALSIDEVRAGVSFKF